MRAQRFNVFSSGRFVRSFRWRERQRDLAILANRSLGFEATDDALARLVRGDERPPLLQRLRAQSHLLLQFVDFTRRRDLLVLGLAHATLKGEAFRLDA